MRAISLLYHDVVQAGDFLSSGFPGGPAARYKIDAADFTRHLAAIAAGGRAPVTVADLKECNAAQPPCLLTFDDGGASAYPLIADALSRHGWLGHFFVTTGYVGQPAFLNPESIRQLHKRGHIIGSHSHSHPKVMSRLSLRGLIDEWRTSRQLLSDILGEEVVAASVPGGNYSKDVASAAAQVGMKFLFTSEPTTHGRIVDGCLVLGRYNVPRGMPAEATAAIASGRRAPRFRQAVLWNLKKLAKRIGGDSYLRTRERLLREKTG